MSGSDVKEEEYRERAKEGNVSINEDTLTNSNCTHNDPKCFLNDDYVQLGANIVDNINGTEEEEKVIEEEEEEEVAVVVVEEVEEEEEEVVMEEDEIEEEVEEETIISTNVTDYVPVMNMNVNESEIDSSDSETVYSDNMECSVVSTNTDISSNNISNKSISIHSPSRGIRESCSCDVYKANRKVLLLKGLECQGLIRRYLSFDDEMITIRNLWPKIESWMAKYKKLNFSAEQAVQMTQLKHLKKGQGLFTTINRIVEMRKLMKLSDGGKELQEIDGQITALIEQGKLSTSGIDGRSLSPTSDLTLDSHNIFQCLEIVQILLGDWNEARQKKLHDIPMEFTAGQLIPNKNDTIDSLDVSIEDSIEEEENDCECQECITPLTSSLSENSLLGNIESPTDNVNFFPIIANGLMKHIINFNATNNTNTEIQLKKLLEEIKDSIDLKEDKDIILKNVEENIIDTQASISQPCQCVYLHAKEIDERKKETIEDPPCPCILNSKRKWDICPCLTKILEEHTVNNTNSHPKEILSNPVTVNCNQELTTKPVIKTGSTQSTQTQTRHSTTQTPNSNHNCITFPSTAATTTTTTTTTTTLPYTHRSASDIMKSTASSHKLHNHNNHNLHAACHKQTNVEHIKRVSCNDLSSGDGDCSDSVSSQEDSSSTSSSAQRGESNKHCDCCYCEAFGHASTSLTPVSRNFNEMRERLRQLLTKKKARKCKSTNNTPKSMTDVALPLSNVNQESKPIINNLTLRSNTSVPRTCPKDQRNLEELLDFIEGNQNGKKDNNKKAEKKARQKQRKLQEKIKKERQEVEKQRLIELQKKTPEVTITVVDSQKPVSQRFLPQCNLPEVSILPTNNPGILPNGKHLTNKKKDKQEMCNINMTNCFNNKVKMAPSVIANLKMKSMLDKKFEQMNSHHHHHNQQQQQHQQHQTNKVDIKSDKIEFSNKTFKGATNVNPLNTKDNANNLVEKLAAMELGDKQLTKKERKKLRREIRKQELAKVNVTVESEPVKNKPQIVTIKRIMESNSAEPTVTITLKGQTPAEDKVLFTLVNGQTKEVPLHKSDQEQNVCNNSNNNYNNNNNNNNNNNKKKKNKGSNNTETIQSNKFQQASSTKQQQQVKVCDTKQTKYQSNNEKTKAIKQSDDRRTQQQSVNEVKSTKSKKDKKNSETKENVMHQQQQHQQQQNVSNKSKNLQQNTQSKKINKSNNVLQTDMYNKCNVTLEPVTKTKNQQEKSNDGSSNKNKKLVNITNTNKPMKNDQQKVQIKGSNNNNNNNNNNHNNNNSNMIKQGSFSTIPSTSDDVINMTLSSQFRDISLNSKINIENLKLPPGITITKVDGPIKPFPLKSTTLPKPVIPPKQTTIIAAPLTGVQSSYASPQAGGNVIVVDTGKLKQDLLPKPNEIELSRDIRPNQTITGKKKKKKNKNSANANNLIQNAIKNTECSTNSENMEDSARILHNPNTNMVTIRNPAFGPMKVPPTQQAAIIKVSENGMVTIRSPALQQAINAGLATPSKPDYIVKGDVSTSDATLDTVNINVKRNQNEMIPSSLAELRSRLTPDCPSLAGLANIQISKVAKGQPIPENGINLKGTSVTLTKVRTDTNHEDVHQTKAAAVRDAINASITASSTSSKGKKKKKRGNGTRQCGDDWNLVVIGHSTSSIQSVFFAESVFTPKDIDLEDGEMDDAERELEAFKRFCLQSVPPPRKEKVNLNLKDIVLKKKSSSSATAAVIAAN
ncbi:hypothetical protein M0802_002141 [Mischocyttarus mexicanus]|nr:hypothetical protein M0802_002141 [Mischocyttarus mexicanus]